MSLLSALIVLRAEESVMVPGNLARATHAWFLDRVRRVDARLADRLHEPDQERPFTVSNLWGPGMPRTGMWNGRTQWAIAPQEEVYVRVTSFSSLLTELLEEQVLADLEDAVVWGGVRLAVTRVVTRPEDVEEPLRPWVGRTTYEALLSGTAFGETPVSRVTLRFFSPTVFRSRGHFMPMPLPRLVFESLARRWNAFSPLRIHEDVARYAEEAMAISRYRLRTEQVRFGEEGERGAMPGCVGQCTYVMRTRDRYWRGVVHALARFALYSGVGKRTSMGLGQARAV